MNFNPETTCDELENSARFLRENYEEASTFYYFYSKMGIYEGTKIYDKYANTGLDYRILNENYLYNFYDKTTANIPPILELVADHTWIIDFLHFEATQLIYMNQLMGTSVGKKYTDIRKKLNDQNYEFFMNAVNLARNKGSQAAIYDLVDDFKAKVNRSIAEYKQLIPQIVSQSKYIIREPLE